LPIFPIINLKIREIYDSRQIGYAPFRDNKIISEYNEEKDIMFLAGEKSFIKIEKGMFALFFPYELHMPGIKSLIRDDVRKIVVKVKA
jgi:YhcH/YjgK/YiaL family protein